MWLKYSLITTGVRFLSWFLSIPLANLATIIRSIHKSQPGIMHVIRFLDKAS